MDATGSADWGGLGTGGLVSEGLDGVDLGDWLVGIDTIDLADIVGDPPLVSIRAPSFRAMAVAVPEPASAALLGVGLLLGRLRRRGSI